MPKHHKHGGYKHSSSSSSSSSSDDEYKHLPKHERKRLKKLKKQMKKGHIPPGAVPGMYPHAGAPGGYAQQPGGYAPPPGGYVQQPGGYAPPPGGYPQQPAAGYAPPPGGYAPPPGGQYGGQPMGYPGQPPPSVAYPAQPGVPGGYPGQPAAVPGAYPTQPGVPGYPTGYDVSQGTGGPGGGVAGGFVPPQPQGGTTAGGYGAPQSYGGASAGGFVAPQPQGGVPGGYVAPPGGTSAGGYVAPQPGYEAPHPARVSPIPAASHHPPPPHGATGVPHGGAPPGGVAADLSKMTIHGRAEVFRPTVVPIQPFSAEQDAGVIRGAMKGAGTDERAIINVISTRSNSQRQEISKMFKTMYGKDIIKDLESELSGNFCETIMALFKPTTFYDAWSLNNAMSGAGTKEGILIEILGTRSNAEIREIVSCYQQYYHRNLEKDIVGDTSGHFKRLLVSCCQANRAELTPQQLQQVAQQGPECVIDRALAQQDAQKIYQAGEKKIGTDESAFLQVMAVRHYYQLRATFEEYVKVSGRDIINTLDREMSGDLKDGFKALVMSARNRPEYFADKLQKAMKGAGTNDSALIRMVVSRSEIDLQDIKEVFLMKYHKTLATAISSDTSGDYKRILLAIVGN